MKLLSISPREHAKKLRAKIKADQSAPTTTDPQRRIDWLVFLMLLIASVACFVFFALRVLP